MGDEETGQEMSPPLPPISATPMKMPVTMGMGMGVGGRGSASQAIDLAASMPPMCWEAAPGRAPALQMQLPPIQLPQVPQMQMYGAGTGPVFVAPDGVPSMTNRAVADAILRPGATIHLSASASANLTNANLGLQRPRSADPGLTVNSGRAPGPGPSLAPLVHALSPTGSPLSFGRPSAGTGNSKPVFANQASLGDSQKAMDVPSRRGGTGPSSLVVPAVSPAPEPADEEG